LIELIDRIKTKNEKFQNIVKTSDTSSSSKYKEVRKGNSILEYHFLFFFILCVEFPIGLTKDFRSAIEDLQALHLMIDKVFFLFINKEIFLFNGNVYTR
jgi:hypothetical protein